MQTQGLEQELEELRVGTHLGMVYQDIKEKMAIIGPFLKDGLARGAYCVYLADESTVEEIADALSTSGIVVTQEQEKGNFQFLSKWEYRQGKELEPDMMIPVVRSLVNQAMTRECPGLWLAVEMTWTLEPEVDQEQLLRWEAILDGLLKEIPAVVLCLYNRHQMAPSVLHAALRTHPLMMGKSRIYQNPYYDPPDLVLNREAHLNKQVDWMLSQLQSFQEQQQALAESEKLYRLLAENARDVVYQQRLVPEVSYDYVSPSITTITGYTPEDFYSDPGLMYKLVHSEDYHILEALKHSPDSFTGPVLLRWIHRDGTLHWVENNITPIYDKSENLIALEGIVRDVTERKQAEEELIRQGEQFRLLVEGVEDYAIFLLDPSGHISTWNSGAQQIKGYQAEEIIGQHFSRFYSEEDIAAGKPARLLRIAAAEGRVEDEGWRVRKDDTRFWADVIITALKNQEGQLRGFAKVTRDMTERRKAEEERLKLLELTKEEEERQHLQVLIDSSPVGVLVVNAPTRQVALVNPEMQRIRGFSYQPGKTLDQCDQGIIYRKPDGQPYEPEDLPLRRALDHGETVRAEEIRVDFSDGSTISTLVNATPILGPEGQITSAIGIIQDLTPVEELEKLRNEFLGMVSHELRTPLSTIKGAAATALRSRVPLSPGENLQFFRIVEDQVDRLTDLVNDLLDMSRIEAGTFAISTEPTELSSVLEEAIVDFGNTYKHHQVQLQIPEGLPAVEADRRRIVQVLTNLLNNAATVSPVTVPITLELEYDEGYVTVHVRDCGRGISQEKQSYLFKKFAHVDESKGGGNSWIGLSLALCKGIVEAHGGRIWANDSGEGNGTTISFTLPKAAKATVPSLVGSLPGALQAAGNGNQSEHFRILIVDDDQNALSFLRRLLDGAGYRPILTNDPGKVLELVELERPDLVLLDLMLPGVTGLDLLQSIRGFSDVPVIFLTASDARDDMISALKMGGDDYITKPFSESELLARIEVVLRRKTMLGIAEATPPYILDGLTINFGERRVTVAGQDVLLSATQYKLLCQLTKYAGRVLTYDQILQLVWGREYRGETELVRSMVRSLRHRLGDNARNPRYIFTVPQVGYRMPLPTTS